MSDSTSRDPTSRDPTSRGSTSRASGLAPLPIVAPPSAGLIAAGPFRPTAPPPTPPSPPPPPTPAAPATPSPTAPAPPPSPTAPAPTPPPTTPQRFTIRGWCELANVSPPQIRPLDPTGAAGTLRNCPRDAIVRFTYRSPVGGALFVLQDVEGTLSWISPLAANVVPTGLRATSEPKPLPVRLRPPLPEGGPLLLFVLAPPGSTGEAVMAAVGEVRTSYAVA